MTCISGRTPLIMAVKRDQTEVVKALLRAGADVQALGENNYLDGYYARYVTYNQEIIELIHAAART